jgi:peptidoglycan/LPS O-acetylase OafA/YrhL
MAAAAADSPQTSNKPNQAKARYRAEIDGLRAFAVVAVIINHFNKDLLPSGYLGVDIFFVISGYVITSSLSERENKSFGDFLMSFYARRIKRLVPALVAFVLVTSALTCLFNPTPGTELKTGIMSLFGLSNFYLFRKSTDYFAQSTELNPFTHTWSLGVEEQFYLLFPAIIWLTGFGRQAQNGARNLFIWIGAFTTASLAAFIFFYQTNQPAAYFLMPPRFWEMAAGCLIFIGFQKRAKLEQALERVPPLLVVAVMTGVMFLPITAAVPATISIVSLSAILIACLKHGTTAFTVFTNQKVVYIGLISYSLYLWHWGVLSISRWSIGIHWWSAPIQITAILALGAASYKYVESRFRNTSLTQSRHASIAGGLSVAAACALAVRLIEANANLLYLGQSSNSANRGGESIKKKCQRAGNISPENLLEECSLRAKHSNSIIAVGDSQMAHLLPLLNTLHQELGTGILYYSQNGKTFPSLNESRSTGQTAKEFQSEYTKSEKAFNYYLNNAKPGDIILLSSRYELRWGKSPVPSSQKQLKFSFHDSEGNLLATEVAYMKWKQLFHNLIVEAGKKGLKVVILNPIPTFKEPLNPSQTNPQWFNSLSRDSQGYPYLTRAALKDNYEQLDNFLDLLEKKYQDVYIFDAFGKLCPPSTQRCSPRGYRDQWHLSKDGAADLYPAFETFLRRNHLIPSR